MKSSFILALIAICAPSTAGAAEQALIFKQGRHGEQIVVIPPAERTHTYAVEPSPQGPVAVGRLSAAGAQLPDPLPASFRWEGDTLVHWPTGARLPKVHEGCRLAAIGPITPYGGGPESFARGGFAEYDCRPATDFTYVTVVFEGGADVMRKKTDVGVAKAASNVTLHETSDLHKVPCQLMDISGVAGHPNRELKSAQCGIKWAKREDVGTLFGSASVGVGRGANYVTMTNTCIGAQCATNRPKFGHFVDTFDQSGLLPDLAPG